MKTDMSSTRVLPLASILVLVATSVGCKKSAQEAFNSPATVAR